MDTLRLVEVTGDGDLVLMTGDGRRFSLSVDEQLRSAVRRSRSGPQVERTADRPGPREVQARIRAGADADEVAQQTGLDVDFVRRFEGPVLAERAHVADLARATAVDRGGDPTLTLERVVLDVLVGEGLDVDDIRWDSRRSDGTRWQVVVAADTGRGTNEATWAFDTSTRSLEPVDAEAERLTGVERRRRLSAVRETVFDVERPAGAAVRGGTVDLLDALARQRGRRPTAPVGPAAGSGEDGVAAVADDAADLDADAPGRDAPGRDAPGRDGAEGDARDDAAGEAGHEAAGVEAAQVDTTGLDAAGPDASEGREQPEVSIEPDLLSELELDPPDRGSPPGRPSSQAPAASSAADRRSKRRRAAVPSWDEIVFGAKRDG